MSKTKQNPLHNILQTATTVIKNLRWQSFILLTLAGSINAFGVTIFLAPVKLYDSGISGTSMLLDQLTPPNLPLSLFLIVLNIPLFLFGLKREGKMFTISSIYVVGVYSVVSYLITYVLPVDVSFASPLAEQDLFLCAIFGGGGHKRAAGCTISAADMDEAVRKLVNAIDFSKHS